MGTPTKYTIKSGCLSFVSNYIEESICFDNIRYIHAKNKVCRIYVKDLDHFVTYIPLTALYNQLPKESFVKIGRSYIIAICEIRKIDCNSIRLFDGTTIPIGTRTYNNIKSRFCKKEKVIDKWRKEFLRRLFKADSHTLEIDIESADKCMWACGIEYEITHFELSDNRNTIFFYPYSGGCIAFDSDKVKSGSNTDGIFTLCSQYLTMTVKFV